MGNGRRFGRRLTVLLGVASLPLLGMTAPAGAQRQKVIGMPLNSTLLIAGSSVACGSGVRSGLGFIDCGITAANGQPKKGSRFFLLTGRGKVNVVDASTSAIVFTRVAAARERPTRRSLITNTAHVGDKIILPTLTQLTCSVASAGGYPTIFCYYVNKRTGVVRANSFSFAISDVVSTMSAWNAAGKSRLVGHWAENG